MFQVKILPIHFDSDFIFSLSFIFSFLYLLLTPILHTSSFFFVQPKQIAYLNFFFFWHLNIFPFIFHYSFPFQIHLFRFRPKTIFIFIISESLSPVFSVLFQLFPVIFYCSKFIFSNRSQAILILSSLTQSENLTNPSPCLPNPIPGVATIPAFLRRSIAKSIDENL